MAAGAAAQEVARLTGQAADWQKRSARAAAEAVELRRQLEQARAELARRVVAKTVVLPAQTSEIASTLQREVLRLMADEGLGTG